MSQYEGFPHAPITLTRLNLLFNRNHACAHACAMVIIASFKTAKL